MAIFTVHQPPFKKYQGSPDPERFAFVRDGFSFWAFLLGPLWMLRHRMWLVLLGYVAVAAALHLALWLAGATGGVSLFAGLMLALLIGLEAGTLRRFTLGRRGWKNLGVIVGDDRESAERRFFDLWMRGEALAPPPTPMPSAAPKPAVPGQPAPAPDVIGLFPQPGARR